jgi:hypothetical protein
MQGMTPNLNVDDPTTRHNGSDAYRSAPKGAPGSLGCCSHYDQGSLQHFSAGC